MSIYIPLIKPVRLYIKKLNDLYYFGKTIKEDIEKYTGSGKKWCNYIKKYGKENVKTLWVSDWYYSTEIKEIALHFSIENNISTSSKWANLQNETGLNDNYIKLTGRKSTKETLEKIQETCFIKYGKSSGQLMSTPSSIIKRNNTNLLKYGNKCAANKSGNKKSIETARKQLERMLVKQIKCIRLISSISLERNWWRSSDEELEQILKKLILNPISKKSYQLLTQQTRQNLLFRENVRVLMMVNSLVPLKLSNNWFQRSDEIIDIIYNDTKTSYPVEFDIALQSYHLLFQ